MRHDCRTWKQELLAAFESQKCVKHTFIALSERLPHLPRSMQNTQTVSSVLCPTINTDIMYWTVRLQQSRYTFFLIIPGFGRQGK